MNNLLKRIIGGATVASLVIAGFLVSGVDRPNNIQGRQIKGNFSDTEVIELVANMKLILSTRPNAMTINEVFAMQDLVNFKCPPKEGGFSFSNYNGQITPAMVEGLLDGNCEQ